MDDGLEILAELLKQRAIIDGQIAAVIGYPAHPGHIGEYIASYLFDIKLHTVANHKASDGHFRSGELQHNSVNIKTYTTFSGLLDIVSSNVEEDHPDYYLVMCGPRGTGGSSKGTSAPFRIAVVYLFDTKVLLADLISRGVKLGIATSVRAELWRNAMIYPEGKNEMLVLSDTQRSMISSFSVS